MLGQYQLSVPTTAPIITVPIPNLPVNVAEKGLESRSKQNISEGENFFPSRCDVTKLRGGASPRISYIVGSPRAYPFAWTTVFSYSSCT
jgi:hypothetical protein